MLCVLGKKLLFKFLYAVEIVVCVKVCPFFHSGKAGPAFRVNYVGVFKGLLHAVCSFKASAGFFSVFLGYFLCFGHYLIAIGMGKNNVHAEACK